jgi:hypothetical protein
MYVKGKGNGIEGQTRSIWTFQAAQFPLEKVVGLERGPLSLVTKTEELLDRKIATTVLENREYDRRIRHDDFVAPSIRKKLAITSPTSGDRSVCIVRSRSFLQNTSACFSVTPCEIVTRRSHNSVTVVSNTARLLQRLFHILAVLL